MVLLFVSKQRRCVCTAEAAANPHRLKRGGGYDIRPLFVWRTCVERISITNLIFKTIISYTENHYNYAFGHILSVPEDTGEPTEKISSIFLDFGWEANDPQKAPNVTAIQHFTNEVLGLLAEHKAIGTEEILGIIHKKGIEAEVFKALSIWLINDREAQMKSNQQKKATIRTIGKIVNNNPNRAEALNGVKALCECELGEDEDIERK